jgi:leader peptidase (prepilin peptidase) / N-methyltransferase
LLAVVSPGMTGFLVVVCGVLGLMIGSFLNVVIWRLPRGESIVRPPSHCPHCDTEIKPYDNIPVISWLVLRGRCRSCGASISPRYPLVELTCGVLWVAMALRFGADWALPAYLVLVSALLALSMIDFDTFLLPNKIVYPLAAALVALFGAAALLDDAGGDYVRALLGGLAAYAFFLTVHLIAPRGMGFGDVKLSFSLGVALGWISWGSVFVGLFLGFLLGAVIGVILIATKVRSRRDHVPFGPFLAAGTVLAILFGAPLLDLYMGK